MCGAIWCTTPSLRGAIATKQSITPQMWRDGVLRFARNDGVSSTDAAARWIPGSRFASPGMTRKLLLDRHPDLQSAIAGQRIEALVVALEVRRVRDGHAGLRQPAIPDRVDGAADARDVVLVGEHEIFLRRDPDQGELARQLGEIRDLDAGDVVEIAGVVAVAADAIGQFAELTGNVGALLVEIVPLVRNAGAATIAKLVALTDAGDEERLAGGGARRVDVIEGGRDHGDRLLEL